MVKEERGNKGAALTTYLSLAGRYSVLMPNTARGGGISRKITNVPDRKRLKEIARELEVPQGMGVILRTAGANRTKAEIKRDFEYLMRLWENVRNLTLSSTAPTLVYEEGSLIKRSIRDLYNKDISEIVVSGEEGYREAKTFMKMLMPSHAKVVQPYRDIHPIFARSGIEAQLDRMLQPQVTLKSGGYIIINQTEALVAIDVNSGRSTKEHSIEDTALQTNLEAAEEVARQLRLRDLAGLIVIDFIDMEEKRNNRAVEKKLKDCLKHDRARIQVGRISHFGLLEMSRQRIRASVLESTTQVCEVCGGTGHVRSKSSVALHCIRGIEEYLLKNTTHNITVRALPDIALYLLNQKRDTIVDLEKRFGLSIVIEADGHVGSQHFLIERGEAVEEPVQIDQIVHYDTSLDDWRTPRRSRRARRRGDRAGEPRATAPAAARSASAGAGAAAASSGDGGADEGEALEQESGEAAHQARSGGRRGRRGRPPPQAQAPRQAWRAPQAQARRGSPSDGRAGSRRGRACRDGEATPTPGPLRAPIIRSRVRAKPPTGFGKRAGPTPRGRQAPKAEATARRTRRLPARQCAEEAGRFGRSREKAQPTRRSAASGGAGSAEEAEPSRIQGPPKPQGGRQDRGRARPDLDDCRDEEGRREGEAQEGRLVATPRLLLTQRRPMLLRFVRGRAGAAGTVRQRLSQRSMRSSASSMSS